MPVQIKQLEVHVDARGSVFEPLADDQLLMQKNVHVVISNPGAVRGNHYHERGTEIIIVLGPALLRYRENEQVTNLEIPHQKVYQITIPPGTSHAIKNTGTTPNVLVAFNTVMHSPQQPDVIRDELIPA